MINPSMFATRALCAGSVFAALGCNGATATSMEGGTPESETSVVDGMRAPDASDAVASEADATDGAFACAEGGTCNAATEFCQLNFASSSGPFGQCVPLPSACLSAPSCTCIMATAALSFQPCTESYPVPCTDSSGQIVVTCAMP
jgi:hypothetical protein